MIQDELTGLLYQSTTIKTNLKSTKMAKLRNKMKKQLEELSTKYFNEYAAMDEHTADRILLIGKCSGIGEALDLIEKL